MACLTIMADTFQMIMSRTFKRYGRDIFSLFSVIYLIKGGGSNYAYAYVASENQA